jgi:microcystin-dependent protein
MTQRATGTGDSICGMMSAMRRTLTAVLVALPALLWSAAARAERIYDQADGEVAHDCATEPEVVINGSTARYTFTGACTSIAVNGAENKLAIESVKALAVTGASNQVAVVAADTISVTGSSNKVTYKKPVSAKKVKVASTGVANKVAKIK